MNLFFFRRSVKRLYPSALPDENENEKNSLTSAWKEYNAIEGSEFLDDAIRMKEQPLMYTEESVAPGNPEGLW